MPTDNTIKVTVDTKIDYDLEAIEYLTTVSFSSGWPDQLSTQILRLQEKQTREALIALGWTPPQLSSKDEEIDRLWERSGHGTRREDIVAAWNAGAAEKDEALLRDFYRWLPRSVKQAGLHEDQVIRRFIATLSAKPKADNGG
jgi:hypothetical protein